MCGLINFNFQLILPSFIDFLACILFSLNICLCLKVFLFIYLLEKSNTFFNLFSIYLFVCFSFDITNIKVCLRNVGTLRWNIVYMFFCFTTFVFVCPSTLWQSNQIIDFICSHNKSHKFYFYFNCSYTETQQQEV